MWQLLLRLEFQLGHQTFAGVNVIARAEINRLIQRKAVPVGIEITVMPSSA